MEPLLKAIRILEPLDKVHPDHPGITHYLIHSYDFAPIARKGIPAANKYAKVAPAAPHAQHMPSHIYSMVGMWQESDWASAIRLLSSAALRDTRNAEIQNYLGYAHRNSGDLPAAFKHYARALQLNPRHRGAHEYLGEAYLMIGNVHKAEEHLSALKSICLLPCREYGQLEKKLAEYRSR